MYKLVICDIDGTLTTNGNEPLNEVTRKALEDLHEAGYLIGLASGRGIPQLLDYPKLWNVNFPIDMAVGLNGCALYDRLADRKDEYFTLSSQNLKDIISIMEPTGLDPYIYEEGTSLFVRESVHSEETRRAGRQVRIVTKEEMTKKPTAKILYRVETDEEMDATLNYLSTKTFEGYKPVRTCPVTIEFMDERASKMVAIEKFCERQNIDLSEVIAFGDTTNDIEMIKGVGKGVCLKNGTDDCKAVADEITDLTCAENGFADYVYKHLLTR